jgi:hypothetical protein
MVTSVTSIAGGVMSLSEDWLISSGSSGSGRQCENVSSAIWAQSQFHHAQPFSPFFIGKRRTVCWAGGLVSFVNANTRTPGSGSRSCTRIQELGKSGMVVPLLLDLRPPRDPL